MGRSVDYLSGAVKVNYFPWPTQDILDDNDNIVGTQPDEGYLVIEDIRETIKSEADGFSDCNRWDGRECHIILEGNGVEIALSEYCGLATLSVRVEESDYSDDETTAEGLKWINEHWDRVSAPWNQWKRIGGFSNGESVYERVVPPKERLEELRKELNEESISYGELAELESLSEHIDGGDTQLLEAAGVPEKNIDADI